MSHPKRTFFFLVDISPLPLAQRITVYISAGLLYVPGFLIVLFSFFTISPNPLTDQIGFDSHGMNICLSLLITGIICCAMAYLIVYFMVASWRKAIKKYQQVFNSDKAFVVSGFMPDQWAESIQNNSIWGKTTNLALLGCAYSSKICFADCRHIRMVVNKPTGGDYSIVIIKDDSFHFDEKKYFNKKDDAIEFAIAKGYNNVTQFLKNIPVEITVILDQNMIILKELHMLNKEKLRLVYHAVM